MYHEKNIGYLWEGLTSSAIRMTSTSDAVGYHTKIAGVIFCVPVYVTYMTSQRLSRIQENNYIGHRWLNNVSSANEIDHQ